MDISSFSAVWGVLLTVCFYAAACWLNRKTKLALCNPLLISSAFLILFLSLMKIPYPEYKASAAPISYLLLPATVSLAIPLYEKWELLRRNPVAILSGIIAGTVTSLGSILLTARLCGMERTYAVTLLPKSVTTAIGMDVAAELGGIAALASAVIILTGIVGNLFAETILKVFRITNPTAKGIAIGTASHAIGTAKAMQIGQAEGAMSGLAIAAAGIITAVLAPLAAQLM